MDYDDDDDVDVDDYRCVRNLSSRFAVQGVHLCRSRSHKLVLECFYRRE